MNFFLKEKKAGAITGKLLKFRFSAKDELSIEKTNIIDSLGLAIFKSHRVVERGGGEEDRGQYEQSEQVFGVSGAASMFRRKALEDVQFPISNSQFSIYFDKDFFAYKEDVDLSFRLRHAGWQCWYVPKALAWHDRWERGSGQKEKAFDILKRRKKRLRFVNYLSYRNHLMMLFKNEFAINLVIYFPWIFLYELKKFIYILFFETRNIIAFLNFLAFLPLTLKKRHDILSKSKINPKEIRSWII